MADSHAIEALRKRLDFERELVQQHEEDLAYHRNMAALEEKLLAEARHRSRDIEYAIETLISEAAE